MQRRIETQEQGLKAAGVADESTGVGVPDRERTGARNDHFVDEGVIVRVGQIPHDTETSEDGVGTVDRDRGGHTGERADADAVGIVGTEVALVGGD